MAAAQSCCVTLILVLAFEAPVSAIQMVQMALVDGHGSVTTRQVAARSDSGAPSAALIDGQGKVTKHTEGQPDPLDSPAEEAPKMDADRLAPPVGEGEEVEMDASQASEMDVADRLSEEARKTDATNASTNKTLKAAVDEAPIANGTAPPADGAGRQGKGTPADGVGSQGNGTAPPADGAGRQGKGAPADGVGSQGNWTPPVGEGEDVEVDAGKSVRLSHACEEPYASNGCIGKGGDCKRVFVAGQNLCLDCTLGCLNCDENDRYTGMNLPKGGTLCSKDVDVMEMGEGEDEGELEVVMLPQQEHIAPSAGDASAASPPDDAAEAMDEKEVGDE